jgi:hypothetical protein
MDERLLSFARVEGVRPAPIGARGTGHWLSSHDGLTLQAVDDRARDQPVGLQVIGADAITRFWPAERCSTR